MSNIQSRLDGLKPYVIGIRLVEGFMVVDVVFKNGWKIPKTTIISMEVGEEAKNYYMLYSEKEGIGVDELLDFVQQVIDINIEREKKYELLKLKVKELQDLFKQNSLSDLENLRFVLGNGILPDNMSEDVLDTVDINESEYFSEEPEKVATPLVKEVAKTNVSEPVASVKSQSNSVETKQQRNNYKNGSATKHYKNQKVELPPKGSIVLEEFGVPEELKDGDCICGDDEACPKCIDRKGL